MKVVITKFKDGEEVVVYEGNELKEKFGDIRLTVGIMELTFTDSEDGGIQVNSGRGIVVEPMAYDIVTLGLKGGIG